MTISFREKLKMETDRRYVPPFTGSVRALAMAMKLKGPRTIRSVMDKLGALDPRSSLFEAGLTAGGVAAHCWLLVNSNGDWWFYGQANEHEVIGHYYTMAMVMVDVADDDNKALVVSQEGVVHGTLVPGPSEEKWSQANNHPAIAKHWDIARRGRIETRLHAATSGWDALGLVVETVVVAGGLAIGGSLATSDNAQTYDEVDENGDHHFGIHWGA